MSGIADIDMIGIRGSLLKVAGFLLASTGLGLAIAWTGFGAGYPLGWIGALALIGWALLARRRWRMLYERYGSEPGAPERVAWQRLSGYALIFGHMAFGFFNPQIDLHVGSNNYLAIDNWSLILGVLASAILFRADNQERDERDDRISARATLWGYRSLIGLLIILLTFVGFLPPDLQQIFNHFVVGNLMVGTIILSMVVRQAVQLLLYAGDGTGHL
jgi:hypothetical protein